MVREFIESERYGILGIEILTSAQTSRFTIVFSDGSRWGVGRVENASERFEIAREIEDEAALVISSY